MNKTTLRVLWAGIGASAASLIFLVVIWIAWPQTSGEAPAVQSAPEVSAPSDVSVPSAPSASTSQSGYLLREYEGKIALYVLPSDTPEEIYDIYVSLLPETDIARLQKGIPADTRAEAEAYLADFDS